MRRAIFIMVVIIATASLSLAAEFTNTSGTLTADALVSSGASFIYKVHVESNGTSDATCTIYNNTSGTGEKLRTITVPSSDTDGVTEEWTPPVAMSNGIYVTISNGSVEIGYTEIGASPSSSIASTKLDDLAAPDDNTDLNASTSAHGLLPKLSGVSTEYLDGTGNWSTVSAASTKLDDLAAPDDNTDLNASASAHGLMPKLSGNSSDVMKGDGSWGTVSTTQVWNKEYAVIDPSTDDDGLWFRASQTMTISAIHGIVDPADSSESVTVDVLECNSDGDACVSILSSNLAAGNTDTAGTLSDTSIASGNWVRVDVISITGTVSRVNLTMNGSY